MCRHNTNQSTIFFAPALQLPAQAGTRLGRAVPQREGDTLAHGHYLGWCQPADHVSSQHGRPAGHEGLELGFLHQPQRGRLSHQVTKTDLTARSKAGLRGEPASNELPCKEMK